MSSLYDDPLFQGLSEETKGKALRPTRKEVLKQSKQQTGERLRGAEQDLDVMSELEGIAGDLEKEALGILQREKEYSKGLGLDWLPPVTPQAKASASVQSPVSRDTGDSRFSDPLMRGVAERRQPAPTVPMSPFQEQLPVPSPKPGPALPPGPAAQPRFGPSAPKQQFIPRLAAAPTAPMPPFQAQLPVPMPAPAPAPGTPPASLVAKAGKIALEHGASHAAERVINPPARGLGNLPNHAPANDSAPEGSAPLIAPGFGRRFAENVLHRSAQIPMAMTNSLVKQMLADPTMQQVGKVYQTVNPQGASAIQGALQNAAQNPVKPHVPAPPITPAEEMAVGIGHALAKPEQYVVPGMMAGRLLMGLKLRGPALWAAEGAAGAYPGELSQSLAEQYNQTGKPDLGVAHKRAADMAELGAGFGVGLGSAGVAARSGVQAAAPHVRQGITQGAIAANVAGTRINPTPARVPPKPSSYIHEPAPARPPQPLDPLYDQAQRLEAGRPIAGHGTVPRRPGIPVEAEVLGPEAPPSQPRPPFAGQQQIEAPAIETDGWTPDAIDRLIEVLRRAWRDERGEFSPARQPGGDEISVNPPKRLRAQQGQAPEEMPVTHERLVSQGDHPEYGSDDLKIPGMPPTFYGRVEKSAQPLDDPNIAPREAARYDFPDYSAKEGQPPMPPLSAQDEIKAAMDENARRFTNKEIDLDTYRNRQWELEDALDDLDQQDNPDMIRYHKADDTPLRPDGTPESEPPWQKPEPVSPQEGTQPSIDPLLQDDLMKDLGKLEDYRQQLSDAIGNPNNVNQVPELEAKLSNTEQVIGKLTAVLKARLKGFISEMKQSGVTPDSLQGPDWLKRLLKGLWDDESGQAPVPMPGRRPSNPGLNTEANAIMRGIDTTSIDDEGVAFLNHVAKAIRENRPIKEATHHPDGRPHGGREYSTLGEGVAGALKATLLAAWSVAAKNIGGNTLYQGFRYVAHLPSAAFDATLARATGKRQIEPIGFRQLGRVAVQGGIQGLKEAKDIMLTGANPHRMRQLDIRREVRYKNPVGNVLAMPMNLVFRAMSAGDRVNWQMSYIRSLEMQARFVAQRLAKGDKAAIDELTKQAMLDPILQAEAAFGAFQAKASQAADFATFNNKNIVSNQTDAIRRTPAGAATVEFGAPFVRVPTNYFFRTVDATPIVNVVGSGKGGAKVARALLTWAKDKEAAVEVLRSLTDDEQATVSRLFGEGLVGTGLAMLGIYLHSKDLLAVSYRRGEESLNTEEGRSAGSIKVAGRWVPIEGLGVAGDVIVLAASLWDAARAPENEKASRLTQTVLDTIGNHPFADYTREMGETMRSADSEIPKVAGQLAKRLVPNFMGQIGKATDTVERSTRPDPRVDDMLGKSWEYARNSVQEMIPGWREGLPSKRTPLGREIPANRTRGLMPVNISPDRSNAITRELRALGMKPTFPRPEVNGVKLSPEQYDELQALSWQYIQEDMNALLSDPDYSTLPPEDKAIEVKAIINGAREAAREMLLDKYGFGEEE